MTKQPQREKHFLQKVSAVTGILCFLSAVICVFVLVVYGDELAMVYNASFAASAIFFFSVGIVFRVMANTNLPKFHDNDSIQ